MENQLTTFNSKWGYYSIFGAVSMLIGAALWGSTGTDLWAALASNTIDSYLSALAPVKTQLAANTSFWILGVILFAVGIFIMGDLCTKNKGLGTLAKICGNIGASLGIVSFLIMLSIAIQIAPDNSPSAVLIAKTIGWIGANMDSLATILLIGASPLILSLGGSNDWVPNWLAIWGYIAGLVGCCAIIGLFVPSLSFFAFVILPFGIGWHIAAGVVVTRKK